MCSQNAANAISGAQISKIFRGGMPPEPPRILVPSAQAPPIFHEVSATGRDLVPPPPPPFRDNKCYGKFLTEKQFFVKHICWDIFSPIFLWWSSVGSILQ
jgi:hypothetical protein